MTRARAFVGAVPQRVWTAVAGLALLASLAVAAVIGAGLSVWRSAVGSSAQPPTTTLEPPSSGLVVLPGAPAGSHPGHSGHSGLRGGGVRAAGHHVVPGRHVAEVRSGGGRVPSPVHARPAVTRAVPVAFTPRLVLANANGDGVNLVAESESAAHARKVIAHAQHQATQHQAAVRARHAAEKHMPRHKVAQHKAHKHKAEHAHARAAKKHHGDDNQGD